MLYLIWPSIACKEPLPVCALKPVSEKTKRRRHHLGEGQVFVRRRLCLLEATMSSATFLGLSTAPSMVTNSLGLPPPAPNSAVLHSPTGSQVQTPLPSPLLSSFLSLHHRLRAGAHAHALPRFPYARFEGILTRRVLVIANRATFKWSTRKGVCRRKSFRTRKLESGENCWPGGLHTGFCVPSPALSTLPSLSPALTSLPLPPPLLPLPPSPSLLPPPLLTTYFYSAPFALDPLPSTPIPLGRLPIFYNPGSLAHSSFSNLGLSLEFPYCPFWGC